MSCLFQRMAAIWLVCCSVWSVNVVCAEPGLDQSTSDEFPTISTEGFRSGIQHWRKIRDDSRFIQAVVDQPSYAPSQVREIVANILLFQRDNGGWPKDYDMLAVLTDEQRQMVEATRSRSDTSFDNGNIHSQVEYLARAYSAVQEPAWRDSCLRGLDFMLAAQLPNGGYPQRFPDAQGYSAHITFNDGVMIGVLNVLMNCAEAAAQWKWLDAERREQARLAVQRGRVCILKCQIRVANKRTGWCQQHDPQTYAATSARTFELASICPQDTTQIVHFLMRFDSPDEETQVAIRSAVEWLQQVSLHGIKVERVPAPPEEFQRHSANFDVVVTADPDSPANWARHYEIGTNRPIFSGRDSIPKYALSEIERERRTGTAWYGDWPRSVLEKVYPDWKRKWGVH